MNAEESTISDLKKSLPYYYKYIIKKTVLDIGCGNGLSALYLTNKYNANFHLLDVKDIRDKKAKNIKFTKGSIHKLPFKDEEFDIAYIKYTLHHLPKNILLKKALSEAYRVAKTLIIIEEIKTSRTDVKKAIESDKKYNEIFHPNTKFHLTKYYTDDEIRKILKSLGANIKSRKICSWTKEKGGLDVMLYIINKS